MGVFLLWKFNLFLRILNWSILECKTLSLSDQSRYGRLMEVSPWKVRARSSEWKILGEECGV